jgi:hypothetical protein
MIPEEIRRELAGSEKVLWHGQPRAGILFRGSDAIAIPFSIMWCGFAIFWESSVLTSNAPVFFVLWGIPFIAVGLYFVVGRFLFEGRQRAQTSYAVTTERIIIVSGVFNRSVKSLNLRTLTDLSFSERGNGEGTITFGPTSAFGNMISPNWPGARGQTSPMFDVIPDAKRVYEIIRKAQREAA